MSMPESMKGLPLTRYSHFQNLKISISLYTNLFDDDYLHEHPLACLVVEYLHFSFNDEILNDRREQEYFQALINQIPIHNNSPSRVHNFKSHL
jgi:hypothetical protein